jgi:hypothetical protein
VLLHHFTKPSLWPQIQREGLRADAPPIHDPRRHLTDGRPCVWFFDVPERPVMSEQFTREHASSGYLQLLPTAFLRLDVTIARRDPRLHPWTLWASLARLDFEMPQEAEEKIAPHCYVFFGDVRPKNIRAGLLEVPRDAELRKVFDAEFPPGVGSGLRADD